MIEILHHIYPELSQDYNLIIANGKFPTNNNIVALISYANKIIACDGASNKLTAHNYHPDYIIGDCDSLNKTIEKQFAAKIIRLKDQNSNDLSKAVNLAIEQKLNNIIILGATGLREDHTLANISLIAEYSKKIENIALISDYGIITAHNTKTKLITIPGQQISLFSPNPTTKINCKELKWPLIDYEFKSWFCGTLNQATHDYIEISSSDWIIVYRAFEIKE